MFIPSRRSFLSGCLALGVAPAVVRAESLMRIAIPSAQEVALFSGAIGFYKWIAIRELSISCDENENTP